MGKDRTAIAQAEELRTASVLLLKTLHSVLVTYPMLQMSPNICLDKGYNFDRNTRQTRFFREGTDSAQPCGLVFSDESLLADTDRLGEQS